MADIIFGIIVEIPDDIENWAEKGCRIKWNVYNIESFSNEDIFILYMDT